MYVPRITPSTFCLLLSLALAAPDASGQVYVEARTGLAIVRWRAVHENSSAPRADLAVGWKLTPTVGVEASVFSSDVAGSLYGVVPIAPIDPTINVSIATDLSQRIGSAETAPSPQTFYPISLNRRISGTAVGFVFTREIAPGVQVFTRQQVVRTSLTQTVLIYDEGLNYDHVGHVAINRRGYQGSAGISWRLPHADAWKLSAEVLYTGTSSVQMTSFLTSVSHDFGRWAAMPSSPLYIAGGVGAAQVAWRHDDGASVVMRKDAALGWRFARWMALETSAFQLGVARNRRLVPHTRQIFTVSPSPGRFLFTSTTITTIVPETLNRSFDGFAAGPVFSWEWSDHWRLFSAQQMARTNTRTSNEFLTNGSAQHVPSRTTHDLRYAPGLGVEWAPAPLPRCTVSAEVLSTSSADARLLGLVARAAFIF